MLFSFCIITLTNTALMAFALKTVAITGASGLVGTKLAKALTAKNYDVIKITTKVNRKDDSIFWNPSKNIFDDYNKLDGVYAVIHLAGENVASGDGPLAFLGRWSNAKKAKILSSRIDGTELIVNSMNKLKKKPKIFLSASAVGYYGFEDSSSEFDDVSSISSKGKGFLANVVDLWESEALKAQKAGIRTVCLRYAPILSTDGGVLAKLLPIFRLGAGGVLGTGDQQFSWITIDDAVRSTLYCLENNSLKGPTNICSPKPVTNKEFTLAMGTALSRPTVLPVPAFAIKTVLGEFGDEMLLGGQRVIPGRLIKAGFKFNNEEIIGALKSLLVK